MNQVPMPASGASSSRLGTVCGPSCHGSVRRAGTPTKVPPVRASGRAVALVEDAQPAQRQQVVDLVDRAGERHDVLGQATGGNRPCLRPQFLAQAADDPVGLPRVPVDHAGADGVHRRLADERARIGEVDLGQLGPPLGERVHRDLDAGRDDPAQVLAGRRDDVIGDRGAEVDADARPAQPGVGGYRVDQAAGPELARVVDPDGHSGLQPRADHEHVVVQVAPPHLLPLRNELGDGRGHDRRVEVGEAHAAQLQQVAQRRSELVRGGLAHGREAPVLDELVAGERSEVRLGVADVDGEEHHRIMVRRVTAKLYVVHGSHPCAAVARALTLKGIDYKVVEYPPPLQVPFQRLRFGARTVPSIKFDDGEKLSGSSAIMRRLEERAPDPPLFPADPSLRARVEEAERWGEAVFQPIARRLLWPAFARAPRAMAGYQEGQKNPALPVGILAAMAPVVTRIERRMNDADDQATRADLQALPDHLDRIDAWIAEGVLGGAAANAADLQIATTLRLMMTIADVRPLIEGRPAGELALRPFPDHPGEVPAGTFPADWLPAASGSVPVS